MLSNMSRTDSQSYETHEQYLDSLLSYYDTTSPSRKGRKVHPPAYRIPLGGAATLVIPHEGVYTASSLKTQPNRKSFASTVMSSEARQYFPPTTALRIRRKGSNAPPLPLTVARETRGHDMPNSLPSGRENAPPVLSKGGRDPKTSSSQRLKPKGARPPSKSGSPDFQRTSFTEPVRETVTPALPVTPPKRSSPTPSQLRFLLQKSTPLAEGAISFLPTTTLTRSRHVQRRDRPESVESGRASTKSLSPIITDFSRMSTNSLQSTPPLSGRVYMDAPPVHSPAVSTPSPKETPTPCDSPVDWRDSPCSIYSTSSVRGTSFDGIQWDSTGYLTPSKTLDYSEGHTDDGAPLKRHDTEMIKDLLRLRRCRAGVE